MGSFEVFHYWAIVIILVSIVVMVLSIVSFKNIFNRFGILKVHRRDFYECGFRSLLQKPVKLAVQFLIVCVFFVIYDIELAFSYPLVSYIANHSVLESFIFGFLYGTFVLSLVYDFDRYLTKWKI